MNRCDVWLKEHPRFIGMLADTPCPCSCPMCGNPRRNGWATWAARLTRQEQRAEFGEAEQRLEAEA